MEKASRKLGLTVIVALTTTLAGYLFLFDGSGPTPAVAQVGTVTFPDLDKLVHYTTVRRGVTREHMLINQTAIDAIKAGQAVPTGTNVVLVDHQNDVLARYLIAQKNGDGVDDWAYQAFNPDHSIKMDDESPARCFSCHQTRGDRQYMFTFSDARGFKH